VTFGSREFAVAWLAVWITRVIKIGVKAKSLFASTLAWIGTSTAETIFMPYF
jgi:hypothetical protein